MDGYTFFSPIIIGRKGCIVEYNVQKEYKFFINAI